MKSCRRFCQIYCFVVRNLFSDSLLPAEEEAAVEAGTQSVTYSPGIFLTEQQNSPGIAIYIGAFPNPLSRDSVFCPLDATAYIRHTNRVPREKGWFDDMLINAK